MMKKDPLNPSEKDWQRAVVKWARKLGWLVQENKFSLYAKPGFPDLVLCRPPYILFAELKSNKGKLRPEQETWIENLQACGLRVYVWRPCDEKIVLGYLA
jgi:hypothetical protein